MSEISEQTEQSQLLRRRIYYRLQMRSVCYVEMGDGNGGVMLNLSEGGFTLQAAKVLVGTEFPRMRFQLPKSERWVETSGKMVWHGQSGKEAGIEFVDLSEEARQSIRDWMFTQTFADEECWQNQRGGTPAWESEKALLDTASIPRPRGDDRRAETQWASFFPNESDLPERLAPASKVTAHAESFFPEETELLLSQTDVEAPAAPAATGPGVESPSTPLVNAQAIAPSIETPIGPIDAQYPAPQPRPAPPNARAAAPEPLPQPSIAVECADNGQLAAEVAARPEVAGDASRIRNLLRTDEPLPRASKGILFDQALAGSLASKFNHLSAYAGEPLKSRTPWFLTATIAFIAGLGFAWLTTFGPLDFIRADIHQHFSATNAARPIAAPAEILGETAPDPPADFDQAPPVSKPKARPPQNVEPEKSDTPPDPVSAAQPRDTQPSPEGIPQQTESSPVSPSVQQVPGDPIGYVASNSRFLSIRSGPGRASVGSDAGGSVRIGQLVYSPQAVYPEQALRSHVQGVVKLHIIIGDDGTIRTFASSSGPPMLVAAATNAVREWRYEPTLIGETPVENEREIIFVFRL